MVEKKERETIQLIGTLVSKVDNRLTIESIPKKQRVEVLTAKDKDFKLQVGDIYQFTCGRNIGEETLWLNTRVKVIILDRSEIEDVAEDLIQVPKNTNDYNQFWTNVRSSHINAIEFLNATKNPFTLDDVFNTSKKFLADLNQYFDGGKKK